MELWLKNDDVILQNMKNIKNMFNVKPSKLPKKKKNWPESVPDKAH